MQNPKPWQIPTFDVFVGNLPGDTDQKKVSKYFTKYGEVQAVIVRDSNTDGKRLAYVKFLCLEDAEKAVSECQNIDINGTRIIVRRAESRKKPGLDRPNKDDGGYKPKMSMGHNKDQGSSSQQKEYQEELTLVTHVESANSLWVQIVTEENMKKLVEMADQLQTLCPVSAIITGSPESNKIYGAQFSEDQNWYRCRVKQSFGTDRIKVLYIDYGNTEEVNPNSLVEIPANVSSIKPCAVRMVFNNIRVQDMHDKKTITYLKKITEANYVRCILKRMLSDQSGYFADMYMEGECLNDKMVEDGYASYRLEMKRREGDGGTRGGGGGFGTPGDREIGGGYAVNAEKGGGDTGSFSQRQVFDETGKIQVSVSNSGRSTPSMDMNHVNSGQDLRPELNAKIQELQKVKFEKEKINGELANLRSRMKVLQNEFSSVSNRLMETSVNNQFHIALELAGKVKKLRCQFPAMQKTPLDEGLDLVNSEDRIQNSSVKSLPDVLSALSKYRGAQKEICMLKDMTSIDSLIEARNTARGDTVNNLTVCIGDLESLPLSERAAAVGGTLSKIRKYYDSYFKFPVHSCPPLDSLMPTFIEWKQRRMNEFTEAREMTDSYQQATMAALTSIQSQLKFDNLDSFEQTDYDLETLLRQYIQGLQHEVSVTDAERSSDAGLLAALVQSLFKELQNEMNNIENYQRLHTEFLTMKSECEPWLNKKPCTEELHGVRKTLRGLKSKLRHRIADRQDLEENEEDSSELSEIKQDINAIRKEIHQALVIEDKLVSDLAKVADGHFPELMKIHPEMGIDIHLEYNGLVKPSQEIEHFDLSPVEGASQGLFTSSFSGSQVFLREQLLSDGDRLDKDEFVRRVAAYSSFKQENVQSIKSVFFDKNARHAYVCSERNGELLSSIVEKGNKPHKKTIQQIIKCTAKALQALHAHNIVHGEVTPQNIVIREEDGTATLLEPDFSQTMKERSRKKYSTPSCMAFMAPELKNAMLKDVFPATDMFNLGMLLLWLHYPDVHFGILADAPDFKAVPLDQSVQVLLSSLLNNLPHLRMTAEQLMNSEYLNMNIPDAEPEPMVAPEPEPEPEPEQQPVAMQAPDFDVMSDIGTFTLDGIETGQSESIQTHTQLDQNQPNPDVTSSFQTEPESTEQSSPPALEEETMEGERIAHTDSVQSYPNRCVESVSDSNTVVNDSSDKDGEVETDRNTNAVPGKDDQESQEDTNIGEASPGLVEIMTGRTSPAAGSENYNLDDVLKGFSKQNSFLKEGSHPPPPLSVLLKGLDHNQ